MILVVAALVIVRPSTAVTVAIIVGLVFTIMLHEFGHYLAAKRSGMKVTEFFLGFGPRIWSFQRGETEYGLKAIPAGAYVKIIGMNNLDEVDPADEERTYRAKPTWRRLSVAVAGSTMHFLLAFVVICTVFIGFGTQHRNSDDWSLYSVSGPADNAGLHPGDRIVSMNGKHYDTYDHLADAIKASPGETVAIVVERHGERKNFTVQLASHRPAEKAHRGYLGISPQYDFVPEKPLAGIARGAGEMVRVGRESVVGLGRLFSPHGMTKYVDT